MTLNPEIFNWARSTAGLSLDEAAEALGFRDTRRGSAADRLASLESGEEEPSRSVLLRMAKAYRRSLLVFYLPRPPRTGDRGQDFRTVPGAPLPRYDPVLDALIRDLQGRRSIVRSLLEEADAAPIRFVGSAPMDAPPGRLADEITTAIQFSLQEFRAQATVPMAFGYLREKLEAAGVFVLLLGNLGSYHTNIPVDTFRGFAIADAIAPFVVVNDQDVKEAWSFTALHETAHLWLGTTGVSGGSAATRIERYCNDVAGEILLPASELPQLTHIRDLDEDQAIEEISRFARRRRISRAMVAYKLFLSDLVNEQKWRAWSSRFRSEWIESRERQRETEQSEGGPNYYVIRRHRLGPALLNLVRHSLSEGVITHTKAAQVLGVKPRNVDPLLHGAPLGRSVF